jgi:hypothetical protein
LWQELQVVSMLPRSLVCSSICQFQRSRDTQLTLTCLPSASSKPCNYSASSQSHSDA